MSYRVPDSACPADYPYGLTVTTDVEAEVEYLDNMPACTNAAETAMWLENDSDAVWELRSTSGSGGTVTPLEETLGQFSFMDAVGSTKPLLLPKAKVSIDRPPGDVNWVVALPYSFGWAAHDLVLDKIETAGEAAGVAALRRRSPAGAAMAACTLAAVEYAKSLSDLEDADAAEVIVDGLGTSASSLTCRNEAKSVRTFDAAGSSDALSDELTHLAGQTEVLEKVHVMDYAQRAAKVLTLGLEFLHRG